MDSFQDEILKTKIFHSCRNQLWNSPGQWWSF